MAEMIRDFFAESKQQMEQWREAKPGSSHMSDQNPGSLLFFWGNMRRSYEPPDIWWLLNKRLFQNTYEPTRIPWNVTSAKELKSRSRGYASMDYRIIDYRTAKGRAVVCWQFEKKSSKFFASKNDVVRFTGQTLKNSRAYCPDVRNCEHFDAVKD